MLGRLLKVLETKVYRSQGKPGQGKPGDCKVYRTSKVKELQPLELFLWSLFFQLVFAILRRFAPPKDD